MSKDTLLTVFVTLLIGCTTIWFSWHIYELGANPPKHLSVTQYPAYDPLRSVNQYSGREVSIRPMYHGHDIKNLVVILTTIQNTGQSPILPGDFKQNLSISVSPPWVILDISGAFPEDPNAVQFAWSRVEKNKFIAQPALLNPGDLATAAVFLADLDKSKNSDISEVASPKLQWGGRIVNLSSFTNIPNPLEKVKSEYSLFDVTISLPGNGVLFVLGQFIVYMLLWMMLLHRGGFFEPWTAWSVIVPVIVAMLSLSAAEAISTYVIGSPFTDVFGVSNWLNAPWIVLNAIGLLSCAFFCHKRR